MRRTLSREPHAADPAVMDTRLHALAGAQDGVFSAAEAHARGVTDSDLRTGVRERQLIRVRRGAYVSRRQWEAADGDERYRLRVLAVGRTRPDDMVSHHAALALHGLPLWGASLDRVDLLSAVRQGVHRADLWIHPRGQVAPEMVRGVLVSSVARAVVRTAIAQGRDCAVIAGDAALHRELVTLDDLYAEVALLTVHEGRARALDAVAHMDGKSESVGESRMRLIFDDAGLQVETQKKITDASGQVIARVDAFVEGVVVEFDGRVKYRADQGENPQEVVWLEKRREDAIRRQGHPVERVVWVELDRPGLLVARVRSARPAQRPERREVRPGA